MSYIDIATKTGIPVQHVRSIGSGRVHKWLEKEFPEEFSKLLDLKYSRGSNSQSIQGRGIIYPNILSPDGKVYNVPNIRQFAKKHNITESALGEVLRGKRISHKGWKLK